MANARKAKELRVAAPNAVGLLANVCKAVAGAGVDLEAVCGYSVGGTGHIMLVARDAGVAAKALRSAGFEVSEGEVVLVDLENRAGTGAAAASKVAAAGIDIRYCYATASGGGDALMVLATDGNDRALKALG